MTEVVAEDPPAAGAAGSHAVVGLDLGGTKIAVATLTDGTLSEPVLHPTERSGSEALIAQLVEMIDLVKPAECSAVGIGVPSVVEFATGRVVSSVNVPLANVLLREVLSERTGVPVYVDNDATVAALAEAHDEHLRLTAHNLVMLTVGTGLGGGIVVGGRSYRGTTGAAGELGHTLIALDRSSGVPAASGFPQPGSLESLAAGSTLDHVGDRLADDPAENLERLRAEGRPILGPDVVRAAIAGDAGAARLVEEWAEWVGIGIANAINTFDPEEVVLGGGAARAGELLLEPATRAALAYVLPGVGSRTTIRLARHGVRAGVLGAALLALHEQEDSR